MGFENLRLLLRQSNRYCQDYCGLFTCMMERDAKFQTEINESKDEIFFPFRFTDPLDFVRD